MSLFKWSTPARRNGDHILPLIPNEIYLHIFEHVAPPTSPLTLEERTLFTNLSYVCRFFANYCLARVFEHIEFSGAVFRNGPSHKTSREGTLCAQIAAQQPLALAIAKTVRICHFSDWKVTDGGAWVGLFRNRFIDTLSHMKHLRELRFSKSFVDTRHGKVIATLGSLEKLVFNQCEFLEPRLAIQSDMVNVTHLEMTDCTGDDRTVIAIHPRYLRTLVMDNTRHTIDPFSESALTELRLHCDGSPCHSQHFYLDWLRCILARAPQSLEALSITVDDAVFDDPFYVLMQSVRPTPGMYPINALPLILDAIDRFSSLRSFLLRDCSILREISSTEVQSIIDDKIGPISRLEYVKICDKVFRPVNGASEASCGTV